MVLVAEQRDSYVWRHDRHEVATGTGSSTAYITAFGTVIGTAFLDPFKEVPPRQEPATFTIDHAVAKLHEFLGGT